MDFGDAVPIKSGIDPPFEPKHITERRIIFNDDVLYGVGGEPGTSWWEMYLFDILCGLG